MIPRSLRPLLTLLPLAALVSACASSPESRTQLASWEPNGPQLTAEQMRTLVTGNTSSGRMKNGVPYAVFYAPDGTQKVRTAQGFRDAGEWRVTEAGELCGKWQNIGRSDDETCLQGYRDGDSIRFIGGSSTSPVQFYRGNAAKL